MFEEDEFEYFSEEDDADIEEECVDGKYYVGSYNLDSERNILLLTARVNLPEFFKYEQNHLIWYLYLHSCMPHDPKLEIIQVQIICDGTYTCVLKTRYIRLIQRKWKRWLKQRQQFIRTMTLQKLRHRELTGRFPFIGNTYTSEDLKWNASGVLDFNSLLITDP